MEHQNKQYYRILAINGGGVRGIIPARILQEFCDESEKQITDLFDYVIGTSIGGIIGAGLTTPSVPQDKNSAPKYDPAFMVNLMETEAQNIFPDKGWVDYLTDPLMWGTSLLVFGFCWGMLSPFACAISGILTAIAYSSYIPDNILYARYGSEGIDNVLEKHFGETKLNDTILPVTLVSYSLNEDRPSTWSSLKAEFNAKDNWYLKDAAGATSAAPTYFPVKRTTHNGHSRLDIDGGIFANSPTFVGISEFLRYNKQYKNATITADQLIVVSIGTGLGPADPLDSMHFDGGVPWVSSGGLIYKMMRASELGDVIESSHIFPNYIRFNFEIDESLKGLDNSSPEHMKSLKSRTEEYISNQEDLISKTVKCLEHNMALSDNCADAVSAARKEIIHEEGMFHFDDNKVDEMQFLQQIQGDNINRDEL